MGQHGKISSGRKRAPLWSFHSIGLTRGTAASGTEVGEPLGRGRLQTDHAQRWNWGRWSAASKAALRLYKNQRKDRNGTFVLDFDMSLRYSC